VSWLGETLAYEVVKLLEDVLILGVGRMLRCMFILRGSLGHVLVAKHVLGCVLG
jgi:hypothetical protein